MLGIASVKAGAEERAMAVILESITTTSFQLVLTDGCIAYSGTFHAEKDKVKSRPMSDEISTKTIINSLVEPSSSTTRFQYYLDTTKQGYEFTIMELVETDIKVLLVKLNLQLVMDVKATIMSLFQTLSQSMITSTLEIRHLSTTKQILHEQLIEYRIQMEKASSIKATIEENILAKVVPLLNSKKEEIRSLRQQLAESQLKKDSEHILEQQSEAESIPASPPRKKTRATKVTTSLDVNKKRSSKVVKPETVSQTLKRGLSQVLQSGASEFITAEALAGRIESSKDDNKVVVVPIPTQVTGTAVSRAENELPQDSQNEVPHGSQSQTIVKAPERQRAAKKFKTILDSSSDED